MQGTQDFVDIAADLQDHHVVRPRDDLTYPLDPTSPVEIWLRRGVLSFGLELQVQIDGDLAA